MSSTKKLKQSIQELKIEKALKHAQELYNAMDWLRDDKNEPLRVIIKPREGKIYSELLVLTFKVSENTNLSTDSVYRFTMEALGILADTNQDEVTENNIQELSVGIEADVYTSDLTAWLNESVKHICYLTQALEELDINDGFQALSSAQLNAKVEVFDVVCQELLN